MPPIDMSKCDKFLIRLNYLIDHWDVSKIYDTDLINQLFKLCKDELLYIDELEFDLFKYKLFKGGLYEK